MTRRLAVISGCLAIGALVVGGLYWLFLNTPESSALMLAASAGLILVMVLVAGVILNAVIFKALGDGLRISLRRAPRGLLWFVLAAVVVMIGWMVVWRSDAWIAAHSGEISAWFIARFGWSDISALFRTAEWVSIWIRWMLLPVLAIAALASVLHDGARALRSPRWLRRAFNWRVLPLSTLLFVVLVALPWWATTWRPDLPPTWIEPTLAAVRLGLIAIVITIGWAMIIDRTARTVVAKSED